MPELTNNQNEQILVQEELDFQEPMYADKKPGFTNIGHGVLVSENWLDDVELNYLKYQADELGDELWCTHPSASELYGKISTNLKIQSVIAKFIDIMMPEYWTNEHLSVNRSRPGDIPPRTFGWGEWGSADYICLYYFGEWEGGNLVLNQIEGEKIDMEIEIKNNQMVLLPIRNFEVYSAKPVTSGIKYHHVDWLYRHPDWVMA